MADIDIIICGAPRCGKTTLANMLHRRLGYPVIHKDAISDTFDEVFPFYINRICETYMRFLHQYIRYNKLHDKEKNTYIFEGNILPFEAISMFHPERNIVYCLGSAELSPDKFLQNIRDNDTEKEVTYSEPDEALRSRVENSISCSKALREKCKSYRVPYIETSRDRPAVLAALADEICYRLEHEMVGDARPDMNLMK